MSSASSASKISARTVVDLARKIMASSSRPEIRSLLPRLTKTLDRTSQAHDDGRTSASVPPSSSHSSHYPSTTRVRNTTERFPWVAAEYERILHSATVESRSQRQRRDVNLDNGTGPSLSPANATYGETPPATVSTLLNLLTHHNASLPFPGQFVDAGSGRGGVVVLAALEGIFPHCRGIEYSPAHSRAASVLRRHYDGSGHGHGRGDGGRTSPSSVGLEQGDLSTERFRDASVVYSNCVVFDAELSGTMGRVLDRAEVRDGAFVVTVTRRFSLPSFDLVDVVQLPCNGGEDFTFYVSQKRRAGVGGGAAEERVPAPAPAVSDSEVMGFLRDDLGGGGMEELAAISLREGGAEGLSLLTALGFSEPNVRLLAADPVLLDSVGDRLGTGAAHRDLKTRAGTSMALRAMAAFPTGRRSIAEHGSLPGRIFASLEAGGRGGAGGDDHPAVRANLVDVLGQVLQDHVGNEVLGSRGVDALMEEILDGIVEGERGSDMLREACEEVKVVRRWRAGGSLQ